MGSATTWERGFCTFSWNRNQLLLCFRFLRLPFLLLSFCLREFLLLMWVPMDFIIKSCRVSGIYYYYYYYCILYPQCTMIFIIYTFSSYNGYKLNSHLTCFRRGFIAQLVEHRTGIAEVMGSNPVGASESFLGFICNCLSYFITVRITFTCMQCTHMIFIIYAHHSYSFLFL